MRPITAVLFVLAVLCVAAGFTQGDAAPIKCVAKGTVKAKSGTSSLVSTLCWDGVMTPATVIQLTWKILKVENYYSGILGNSTNLLGGVKFATVWPPVKNLKTFDGADTADALVGPSMFARKAALLQLLCSGSAEIGILTHAPTDTAPKVAFKQAIVVDKRSTDDCDKLKAFLG